LIKNYSLALIKDKKQKADEKPLIEKLDADHHKAVANIKYQLIEKLFELVNGRTSQGVHNILGEEVITKGTKFTQKLLEKV
jgi:DNA-directed RNA polymerase subunit beta